MITDSLPPSPSSETAIPGRAGWRFAVMPGKAALAALALAAALAVGTYLISSALVVGGGYPLDDAWIHQTYARNLAQRGEWAFLPGQPSAGSTAPLWSLLLAGGYLLRIPHLAWSALLGGLTLLGLALAGEAFVRAHLPGMRAWLPWVGLLLVGEWHLAWAAVSGMETLLAALVVLAVLAALAFAPGRLDRGRGWFWIGLLVGASVWIRPDGLTLLGPAGLVLLLAETGWRRRAAGMAWLAGGWLLVFAPYLLFNLQVQGSVWPNTFYAKQAEYAVLLQRPLLERWLGELKLPLIGGGLFLLPGFLAFAWQAVRQRRWAALAAVIWFLGYGLVYALRLPVTYQYGRYFMPAMPVYFCAGLAGTALMLPYLRAHRARWLLARVWLISGVIIWVAFFGIGANRYAQDVAIIETEMVAAAKWVADNTPEGTLVAAHDIGALGYYAGRPLLDLAGLISPEVIPFIRDEARLGEWLDDQQADYLVVFADWYDQLPKGKPVLFATSGEYARAAGGDNTLVLRWRSDAR